MHILTEFLFCDCTRNHELQLSHNLNISFIFFSNTWENLYRLSVASFSISTGISTSEISRLPSSPPLPLPPPLERPMRVLNASVRSFSSSCSKQIYKIRSEHSNMSNTLLKTIERKKRFFVPSRHVCQNTTWLY